MPIPQSLAGLHFQESRCLRQRHHRSHRRSRRSLGEHGEETHGLFLYDSTLHIPLILKMPGTAHRATVVDTQVRTTDILQPSSQATGVAPPAELNGESLLPLIAENPGTPSPSGRPSLRRDRLSSPLGMAASASLTR